MHKGVEIINFQAQPAAVQRIAERHGLQFTGAPQHLLCVLGQHTAMHFKNGGLAAAAPLLSGPAFTLGLSFISRTNAPVTLFAQGEEGEEGYLHVSANVRFCPLKKELKEDVGNLMVFWLVKATEKHPRYRYASCRISKHLPVALLLTGQLNGPTELYIDGFLHTTFTAASEFAQRNSVALHNATNARANIVPGALYMANSTASAATLNRKLAAVLGRVPTVLHNNARAFSLYHIAATGKVNVELGKQQLASFAPVGLSKLMTLYLALEHLHDTSQEVEVLEEDIAQGSGNNLHAGDVLTLEALLFNLALASSNTSANVLARIVGAGLPPRRTAVAESASQRFVRHMNHTARTLGMHNTLYLNPSGVSARGAQRTNSKSTALLLTALVRQGRASTFYRLRRTRISMRNTNGEVRQRYITSRFPLLAFSEPHFLLGHSGALVSPKGYLVNTAGVADDGQDGFFVWAQMGMQSTRHRTEELGTMLHYLRLRKKKMALTSGQTRSNSSGDGEH